MIFKEEMSADLFSDHWEVWKLKRMLKSLFVHDFNADNNVSIVFDRLGLSFLLFLTYFQNKNTWNGCLKKLTAAVQ